MTEINPIGQSREEIVLNLVKSLASEWKELESKPKWWQFTEKRKRLSKAIAFMVKALDILIVYVDDLIDSGPDKKATVLAAVNALYSLVIKDLLPWWIIPFAVSTQHLVIYILVSVMIDYVVDKYRTGVWKMEKNAQ